LTTLASASVVQRVERWTCNEQVVGNNLGSVVHTYVPLSPSSITWYRQRGGECSAAGKVTAGLAESNGSLPPGGWRMLTWVLTACTPGSAPGPTLGNKYRKPLTFFSFTHSRNTVGAH